MLPRAVRVQHGHQIEVHSPRCRLKEANMASEGSVERQFRFQCACGATTISGEKSVTCMGCGAQLGIRKVRRHRQSRDSVTYYGSRTLPVRRVERIIQRPIPAEPLWLHVINEPSRRLIEGVHVKVGRTRPDGTPHPHAGKTGRITRLTNAFTNPYWLGLPSAIVKLDPGFEPPGFIWVSLQCLEALPEDPGPDLHSGGAS